MAQTFDPSTNTYRDNLGTSYQTPDTKPALYYTPVTAQVNGQYVQGTIQNGVFTPNKR